MTANFGMLDDIIITKPNAYIAFAGKRVIEQTLNTKIPEGSQTSEYLFYKPNHTSTLTIPTPSTKTTRNVSKKCGHTTYKKFTPFLISKDRVS